MPVRVETRKTSRFIDPWLCLAIAAALAILVAGIVSLASPDTLIDHQIEVPPSKTVRLEPISVRPAPWGAIRINVRARLRPNRWVAFEIQVLDEEDRLLGSAIKEAWRRSASSQGSNLRGGLDLRPDRPRSLTLAIAVLDAGPSVRGRRTGPVAFTVRATQGVADGRYLLAGFLGCSALAALAVLSRSFSGTPAIAKTIVDSEVCDRATVGGPGNLVRVIITTKLDETRPERVDVCLRVRNAWGELAYTQRRSVNVRQYLNSNSESIQVNTEWLLILQERGSYSFFAAVTPDEPVYFATLQVLERARTTPMADVTTVTTI